MEMTKLREDATKLFSTLDGFIRGGGNRRNPALENFPDRIQGIALRLVYKPSSPDAQTPAYYPDMERWMPEELSFGGAGIFWCFTVLVRSGENVNRRTEDGRAWSSKTGRVPKNGFPAEILVDKLVISDKSFHMLELTLADQEKPIVALCKIWRNTGVGAPAASPQSTLSSVGTGGLMDMEIDQPQQVNPEVVSQQHVPASQVTVNPDHFGIPNLTQVKPEVVSQQHVPASQVTVNPDHFGVPNLTQEIQTMPEVTSSESSRQIDTTFQKAVTNLFYMKSVFGFIAIAHGDAGKKIASAVQFAASSMSNILNINPEDYAPSPQPSSNGVHDNEFIGGSYYDLTDDEWIHINLLGDDE